MRSLAILLALALPALADVVVCKDGRRITGKIVEETEAHVKVTVKNGAVTIPRYQVKEIVKGATPDEIYEERRAAIDASDARKLLDLAIWCRENKLKKQAEAEFQRVLALDPENEAAHKALDHVLQDGVWMSYADACRARGLVEFDDQWITPEEAKLKRALKEQQELERAISDKVRECLRKLSAPDVEGRDEARAMLERIPADLKFTPLLEHVESKSAEIRSYCIGALSTYDRPEVMPKLARRILVDESDAIRGIAVETLKKINHPDTWLHLQKGLQSDYAHVRIRAANALCDFPNERAAEALLNALVRVEAPKGGFEFGSTETDPRLAGDPKMTPEARKALEAAGRKPGGGMNPFDDPAKKARKDQDEKEKAAVVRALEACTGLAYGDNIDAWRDWWLQKHAATAAREQMGGKEKEPEAPEDKK